MQQFVLNLFFLVMTLCVWGCRQAQSNDDSETQTNPNSEDDQSSRDDQSDQEATCIGVVCDSGPPSICSNDSVLLEWDNNLGTCEQGECFYNLRSVPCSNRCFDGRCMDESGGNISTPDDPFTPESQETDESDHVPVGVFATDTEVPTVVVFATDTEVPDETPVFQDCNGPGRTCVISNSDCREMRGIIDTIATCISGVCCVVDTIETDYDGICDGRCITATECTGSGYDGWEIVSNGTCGKGTVCCVETPTDTAEAATETEFTTETINHFDAGVDNPCTPPLKCLTAVDCIVQGGALTSIFCPYSDTICCDLNP